VSTTTSTTTSTAVAGSPASGTPVEPRMTNPAYAVPGAMAALLDLGKAIDRSGLPARTRDLVHVRASQINGCGVCGVQHQREAKRRGESDERLWAVAGWRDAPYYTPAERAALALTEAVSRLADTADPVPDAVWDEAARHFDPPQLGALVLTIGSINLWNRLNVTTRQVAGQEW
jgi:AhpD family alkylhydroperoxidase